ncbi:MAG: hypothetical protein M9905_05285, partial [Rhizobiaceae bacterium]|nr:hypothetical protein [Rhizobiaceae bacterium]
MPTTSATLPSAYALPMPQTSVATNRRISLANNGLCTGIRPISGLLGRTGADYGSGLAVVKRRLGPSPPTFHRRRRVDQPVAEIIVEALRPEIV